MKLKETQTSLLDLLPAVHDIGIEHLPENLSLRPGLTKIVVTKTQGSEQIKFQLPVQWTPTEAAALIHEIRGTVWQLGEDGVPIHLEEIIEICEEFCKERLL